MGMKLPHRAEKVDFLDNFITEQQGIDIMWLTDEQM